MKNGNPVKKQSNPPKKWSNRGFIWVAAKLDNREYKCFDIDGEKDVDFCDPYFGDDFYVDGDFDKEFIKTGKQFIDKIKF